MINKVNVINNVGDDLKVEVENKGGVVQILIDSLKSMKKIYSLDPGNVFMGETDNKYIVCEKFSNGTVGVTTKDALDKEMSFGANNNFNGSNWDKYLSENYIKEIELDFGADNIVEHEVDLLSMDGYDDYGVIKRKVAPMTFDQFRKYHKYTGNVDKATVLATPNSTPSGWSSSCVRCVDSDGYVCYCGCNWYGLGVRPFFILKSDIFIRQ